MAKKFKLTQSQYDEMIAEGVTIQGEVDSSGKADPSKTASVMSSSGIDPNKVTVEFNGAQMRSGSPDSSSVTEHRLVTKKELQANRLRYLKENSEILSFNNFLKRLQ